jgi:hypothetical protein
MGDTDSAELEIHGRDGTTLTDKWKDGDSTRESTPK